MNENGFYAEVAAEARRRYGLPGLPDGLNRDIREAQLAGKSAVDLVAAWGVRFGLEDLPSRIRKAPLLEPGKAQP